MCFVYPNEDCDDNIFCNGKETCVAGTGVNGTPPSCDDGVGCTEDTCDVTSDACMNTPDDASCDDGDVCTGTETCDATLDCQAGTPLDCDDQELCTTDSCNSVNGCANVPVECPVGEQCDSADGICKAEPECTVDADCNDGFFCNGSGPVTALPELVNRAHLLTVMTGLAVPWIPVTRSMMNA